MRRNVGCLFFYIASVLNLQRGSSRGRAVHRVAEQNRKRVIAPVRRMAVRLLPETSKLAQGHPWLRLCIAVGLALTRMVMSRAHYRVCARMEILKSATRPGLPCWCCSLLARYEMGSRLIRDRGSERVRVGPNTAHVQEQPVCCL